MNFPALPATDSKPRSSVITILAWLMMIMGILGLPISLISALKIAVQSYGTQTSDPLGFTIIVLGPYILLITGFGLLRRWWWARWVTLALLVIVIAHSAWQLAKGPRPTTITHDAAGVPTTITASATNYSALPIIAVCVGCVSKLLAPSTSAEFSLSSGPPKSPETNSSSTSTSGPSPWRVGHRGRDMMFYEENVNGKWERLDIDGEMLMGRAHHVIYFASQTRWQTYPDWARHRRSEIIALIKSEFRSPDYEYQGDEETLKS